MKQNIFTQGEAMCFMWYLCAKCGTRERIWNSRPRITPFCIPCAKCGDIGGMNHVDWNLDEFAPNHIPKPGERVFVDLTYEAALALTRAQVDRDWEHPDYPMSSCWATKEEATQELMANFRFGEPAIEVVR